MENRLSSKDIENCDCGSSEPIMTTLNKFVQAVEAMDETVMIPSRLRDMNISLLEETQMNVDNNNKAVVPFLSQGTDLYSFYQLLKTIKSDLTVGTTVTESEENLNETNDESNTDGAVKAAKAFRYHLRGLFSILRQMTVTANLLSEKYESEVNTSRAGVSSFAL